MMKIFRQKPLNLKKHPFGKSTRNRMNVYSKKKAFRSKYVRSYKKLL